MGHTKAENDIAIEQIKKLNEINPLKEYCIDSFVLGMRYGQSKEDEQKKVFKSQTIRLIEELKEYQKVIDKDTDLMFSRFVKLMITYLTINLIQLEK